MLRICLTIICNTGTNKYAVTNFATTIILLYYIPQLRTLQDTNNQGNGQAFLYGNQGNLPPRPPKRDVDNRPAWMSRKRDDDKNKEVAFEDTPIDVPRKKINRLWAYSANIFISDTTSSTPPMPLDVDNGLPGIELWFGTSQEDELCFICHMDTCAAMNTGNLTVHKWLMTKYPHLVAEYIQFDDSRPFEPLKLHCAVEDLVATESLHGKLTSIVRYWIRYSKNDKKEILSFGLGDSVAVNSLVGIPTIKAWQYLLDFEDSSMISRGLNTKFPLIFEATKHGLPPGVGFLLQTLCGRCKVLCRVLLIFSQIWELALHPQKMQM